MLHKIKFQNNIYNMSLWKRTTTIKKKQDKQKNKTQETKKGSKQLIAALEEVIKISGITFENHQRGSSV